MTDTFKEKDSKKHQPERSFKEQILEELRLGNQDRERRRQEILAKEEEARQRAEAARLEAERQAQLAQELAARQEEEARRKAALEAELAELARQEEAARLEAERRAELARQEEAARLEAERQAELARQEEAARLEAERQAELARQEEVARLEAERQAELERLERERQEEAAELARLEAERQQVEAEEARLAEEARRLAELEQARQAELAEIEELERAVAQRQAQLANLSQAGVMGTDTAEAVTGDQEAFNPLYQEEFDTAQRELEHEGSLSETAIPSPVLSDEGTEDVFADQLDQEADLLAADAKDEESILLAPEMDKRKTTNKLAMRLSLFLATIIVLLTLLTAFFGYRYISAAIKPSEQSTEMVQVEIPNGSGNKLIGQILEEAGVIKSGTVFNYYTKFKNYSNFQSGFYNFSKNMSMDEVSKLLQEGGSAEPVLPSLGKVVIPEGYTLAQIAKAVTLNGATEDKSDVTPFTEEDFYAIVQDPAFIARMVEKYPNLLGSLPAAEEVKYQLEGYLFPATYAYYEESTLEGLIEEMIAAMDANLAPHYDTIASRNMTVNDILTLASLVEKEGSTDDDRKQIASVFYNRLGIDMPLQSNIAILYAMDKLGEKTTLAEDAAIDTAIDSPFNIYLNPGLMPGPVDSPGLSALNATISPADTDYLYFVADVTTGVVYYAETFEDHNANVEQYVNSKL